jgi:hypothetical protein
MAASAALPAASSSDGRPGAWPYRSLVWALVSLALGLRLFHYLRNPAIWCDEVWLLRNIMGKSFLEQLGPLVDRQAAPPLFLWAERGLWIVFGSNLFVLRLLPLLASCGAVLLLVPLGRRCLRDGALPWAVLLLGFSDSVLDYTCQIKPYSVDALLGVAVPLLFCATRRWRFGAQMVLFTALAPVVIFLAYPGCFIYGGLLVALLPGFWERRREATAWLGYALLVLTTCSAFVLLATGPIRAQRTAALEACWKDYPDWHHPWVVPGWSVASSMRLLEHLWRPTGGVLILSAGVGAFSLWQRRRRTELLVMAAPVMLALLAAWVRAYPFNTRLVLFAVGPLALLIGEGVALSVDWLIRQAASPTTAPRWLTEASLVILNAVVFVPLLVTMYHIVVPWPRVPQPWPKVQDVRSVSGTASTSMKS